MLMVWLSASHRTPYVSLLHLQNGSCVPYLEGLPREPWHQALEGAGIWDLVFTTAVTALAHGASLNAQP